MLMRYVVVTSAVRFADLFFVAMGSPSTEVLG
jgi:hypothetical protein